MNKISGAILLQILVFIAINISSVSCTHESDLIEKLDTVCFETEIFPIISSSCGITGCHGGGGSGEFSAYSYNSIMEAVTPGDAKNSLLYKVLTRPYGEIMPPDKPLNKNQRTLIRVWIQQGALNTKCNDIIGKTTIVRQFE